MLKMTIEEFDRLTYSNNIFDRLTGSFLGVSDFILENWAVGNTCKLYDFLWENTIIASIAHQQEAIEFADAEPDEPDVDESFYDPYMGCDFYEPCDYMDWQWNNKFKITYIH